MEERRSESCKPNRRNDEYAEGDLNKAPAFTPPKFAKKSEENKKRMSNKKTKFGRLC